MCICIQKERERDPLVHSQGKLRILLGLYSGMNRGLTKNKIDKTYFTHIF